MLHQLPAVPPHDRLLVGTDTLDDAGIYQLTDDVALVQTVDFFTPVVDDPRMFGRIAAANALSDVYAMGGQPITALNLMGFPSDELPLSVMAEILSGGQEKVNEAGATLLGGHTVVDGEPKYGLAVTGTVHPHQFWTHAGARPGDVLYLTKPLGIGVITTALKNDAGSESIAEEAMKVMAQLNASAAEAGRQVTIHACTDVTGFGLLGHLREMAAASKVDVQVNAGAIPVIEGTFALVDQGFICGGSRNNLAFLQPHLTVDPRVYEAQLVVMADAITSGGLLFSVSPDQAPRLEAELNRRGVLAAPVGNVTGAGAGRITIKP